MAQSLPLDSTLSQSPVRGPLSKRENSIGKGILWAFLAIITLPYLFAALWTPPGYVWTGLLFSADDQSVHLMWARQAQEGAFVVRDLFTTEGLVSGEHPLFFNLLTNLMGWLAKLTHLEVAFPYHILRVALAAVTLWQLHELTRAVTKNEEKWENARLWTLALGAFTLGCGFLAPILPLPHVVFFDRPDSAGFPLIPEAYLLTSALLYPLNIASFGLLAFLFSCLIESKRPVGAFFAALLLSNIHTYDALPLLVAAFVGAAIVHRQALANWKTPLAVIVGGLIPIAYQFVVFSGSEEFRLKALTVTAPSAIWNTLLAFLPLILLALWGWKKTSDLPARRWLLVWFVATLALVYAPTSIFPFARKMLEGAQIPLLVLAGFGLAALPNPRISLALVAVLSLSPIMTGGWIIANAMENNASRYDKFMAPLYLTQDEAGALRAINDAQQTGAVLCLPYLGNYVPRATDRATYCGHWAETLKFSEKLGKLNAFYSGKMSDDEARQFLRDNKIDFIIESRFETQLFPNSTALRLGLKPIYSQTMPDTKSTTTVYVAS